MIKYIVKKPFKYNGKELKRGDVWLPSGGMHDNLIIRNETHVMPAAVENAEQASAADLPTKETLKRTTAAKKTTKKKAPTKKKAATKKKAVAKA